MLPKYITKYFWGDDLSQLSWSQHQEYITKTILEKGNRKAANWLFDKVDKKEIEAKIESFNLSPKSDNFWRLYLS